VKLYQRDTVNFPARNCWLALGGQSRLQREPCLTASEALFEELSLAQKFMLVIRFLRTGKKNQPSFKLVVVEKTRSSTSGRFVQELGFYNPLTKEKVLKRDRIKYWLSIGAQPSDTVHNLLVSEKIIEREKIPKHKKQKSEKEKVVPAAPVEEKPKEEEPKEEEPKEEKVKSLE